MYRIILASASPRRKEILTQVGVRFEVMVSEKEEIITEEDPVTVVRELALGKVEDIAEKVDGPAIIIGADTVVVHKNRILGKPLDEEDAFRMLEELSDDIHEVYTGVALIIKTVEGTDEILNFAVCTKVGISAMSSEEILRYVATGEPLDKAGAYGIQGRFAIYVNKLEGDFYNVMGLPISAIHEKLMEQGIDLIENV